MNNLEQEIDCLKLKNEGLKLEYEYVNEQKRKKIYILEEKLSKEEEKNKQLTKENQELKSELKIKNEKITNIENSRFWKLRNWLRREK